MRLPILPLLVVAGVGVAHASSGISQGIGMHDQEASTTTVVHTSESLTSSSFVTTSTSTTTVKPTAPPTAAPQPLGVCPFSLAPFNGVATRRRITSDGDGNETVASFIFSVNPTTPTSVLPDGATTHCDEGSEFYVAQFDLERNGECVVDGLAVAEARAPMPVEGGCRYYFTRDDALDAEEKRDAGMYQLEQWAVGVASLPPALTSSQHTTVVDVLCEPDASLPSYYALQLDAERAVTMIDYTDMSNRTFTVIKGYSYWACAAPLRTTTTTQAPTTTTTSPATTTTGLPTSTTATEEPSHDTTSTQEISTTAVTSTGATTTDIEPSFTTTTPTTGATETETTSNTKETASTTATPTSAPPSSSEDSSDSSATSTSTDVTSSDTPSPTSTTETTTASPTPAPTNARAVFVTSLWERELEEAIRAAVSSKKMMLFSGSNTVDGEEKDIKADCEREPSTASTALAAEAADNARQAPPPLTLRPLFLNHRRELGDSEDQNTSSTTSPQPNGHRCHVTFSNRTIAEKAVFAANNGDIQNVYSAEMETPTTTAPSPDKDDDDDRNKGGLSKGAVVGIVFGVLLAVCGGGAALFFVIRRTSRTSSSYDLNEAINTDDTISLGSKVHGRGYY